MCISLAVLAQHNHKSKHIKQLINFLVLPTGTHVDGCQLHPSALSS